MSEQKNPHISDHLANERTFLAWIRTAVGIMAFGFVVVKFSLFVKELSLALNEKTLPAPGRGYSAVAGIGLVVIGTLLTVLSFVRFKKVQKQINREDFRDSSPLITMLTGLIFLMGIFLVGYLLRNIQ
ncbi:MAG TPA: DUF202 domain-containing protein [Puia sp.]|nr:DUF202 domain-containing protein [Puia sp.]